MQIITCLLYTSGDIAELCGLVKPDYAVFTGVCAQHVETFGSEENILKEMCIRDRQ